MIVDASVAIKWLVPETDSDRAVDLLARGDLTAPDLIFSEVSNGLWRKWRRGEIVGLPNGYGRMTRLIDTIRPTGPLFERASAIAFELTHPAYDCFYLALAEQLGDVVVTADNRLIKLCGNTAYSERLLDLSSM